MTTILIKRSNTPGAVPVAGDLTNSTGGAEIAINTADKRLFSKDGSGNVIEFGTGSVTSVALSGGTTGLTVTGSPITTSGTFTLSGTLSVANGGTGQTTYTNGQLLIGNTTGNTLTKATLTAGSGISVTNGAGSITIAATATGGAQDYIVQSYGIV